LPANEFRKFANIRWN